MKQMGERTYRELYEDTRGFLEEYECLCRKWGLGISGMDCMSVESFGNGNGSIAPMQTAEDGLREHIDYLKAQAFWWLGDYESLEEMLADIYPDGNERYPERYYEDGGE